METIWALVIIVGIGRANEVFPPTVVDMPNEQFCREAQKIAFENKYENVSVPGVAKAFCIQKAKP